MRDKQWVQRQSISQQEALERRAELEADWRAYLRTLGWCRCSVPHPSRRYLGQWACRVCGLFVRWRSSERSHG